MTSFLGSLAKTLVRILEPLTGAFENEGTLEQFLEEFGWNANVDGGTMATIRTGFALGNLFQAAEHALAQFQSESADELTIARQLLDALVAVIQQIRNLITSPPAGLPFPFDQADFWNQVPRELLDYLVVRYLESEQPVVYGTLLLLGLVDLEEVHPAGTGRVRYEKRELRWERLGRLVGDPSGLFREIYNWGNPTASFDHRRLLRSLERLFLSLSLPARLVPPRQELAYLYYAPTNPTLTDVRELALPLLSGVPEDGSGYIELGLLLLPIPPKGDNSQPPAGLFITPLARGFAGGEVGLGRSFALKLSGGFEADGAVGLEVRPGSVDLKLTAAAITIDAGVALVGRPPKPWILIGSPGSHRIELGGMLVAIKVRGPITDPELTIEAGTGEQPNPPKLALVVQASDADGFIQKIFGSQPQRFEFDGLLSWSSKTGLKFSGHAGLSLVVPINLTIGTVEIETLYFGAQASGDGVEVVAAVTGSAGIGPIAASVEKIGVKLSLTPVPDGQPAGNLGKFDLAFGFKPPDGLGIVIDAGPITGGGFISFDEANGRYAGVLQLSVSSLSITAIGLLDTKLPGGRSGYSFLIIVTVEFSPIQIGFGFTLNGVGGLAGIHRTIVTDALQAGVRNHSLDHILFPEDPVRNAPQIISDLRTIFPPAEGRFVFGPMAIIGWGSPTLIEAELGIILELPDPIRIIILGQLNVHVPTKDAAIIEIHLDVLGIIDFGKKLFSIDATLHDSRIVVFSLYGDMAMRLNWGDEPSFALSLGGFNPHFQPPPNFPQLRRLTLSLSSSEEFSISLQTYMAVTSNTFQVGALIELHAGDPDSFNIYGWFGFDALFTFSPFSFIVDFSAGLALRDGTDTIMGIHVHGELSGPTPWHVKGEACISILFFDICIGFDRTFGEEQTISPTPINPWADLKKAIEDPRNWSGVLPPAALPVVSVSPPEASTAPVLIDPVGIAQLLEKVLPLDQKITKYGEAPVSGTDDYTVQAVTVGGQNAVWSPTKDYFAAAQFEVMSDAEKLSRPSFERMDAGIAVGSNTVQLGLTFGKELEYETKYIDSEFETRSGLVYRLPLSSQLRMTERGAAALSLLNNMGLSKFAPPPGTQKKVIVDKESFVVATTDDMSIRADISPATTKGAAYQALSSHLSVNPEEKGRLQVIPLQEAI